MIEGFILQVPDGVAEWVPHGFCSARGGLLPRKLDKITLSQVETSEREEVMGKDTLTIIDNRTGRSYEVEVREGSCSISSQ